MEDFSNIIQESLNTIFSKIFSSLDNSFYHILDTLAFINPTILDNNLLKALFTFNSTTGLLVICNSIIWGLILYYAVRYLFSHLIYSKNESPIEFILKAIIFSILMNNSLWICEQIIFIIDVISSFLIYSAETLTQKTISFSEFLKLLNTSLFWIPEATDIFSFSGIVKSFSSVGLINLVFTFALRYIMVLVFVILSPFAMLSLLNSSTTWIFKSWTKSFFSLLFFQIIIAILLIISFSLSNFSNTLLLCIFYVGIIQAFQKSSFFVKELFGGITLSMSNGFNPINTSL